MTSESIEGKVLYIYVESISKNFDDGIAIESCRLCEIAGRRFVVGRTFEKRGNDWLPGPETSIAWDSVSAFLVYESRDEIAAAYARYTGDPSQRSWLQRIFGKPA